MISFPDTFTSAIHEALVAHPIFALCGPPGSGKKTILKQMGYENVYPLDEQVYFNDATDNLTKIMKKLQPTLLGDTVWIVYPAELLTRPAVAQLLKRKPCKVILLSCDKVPFVPIVYMKQFDKKENQDSVLNAASLHRRQSSPD